MLPPLEHFPVHWVDGMKISKQHFQDLEHALMDQVRDALGQGLHADSYGLLLPLPGLGDTLDLQLQQQKLILHTCRALTVGGARIDINRTQDMVPSLEKNLDNLDLQQGDWYVVVSVDLFRRKPVGMPNPAESPPRIPFTSPQYELQIIPVDTLPETAYLPNQVIVGKLKTTGTSLQLDTAYIPPCTRMRSHQNLVKVFEEQVKLLLEILNNGTETIQNIFDIKQPDALNQGVRFFAEKVVFAVATMLDQIRLNGFNGSPLYFFTHFIQVARTMEVALNCIPDRDKDSLVQYFSGRIGNKVSNFKHHDFEHHIQHFLNNFNYAHEEIYASAVSPVNDFLSIIYILFQQIAPFEQHTFKDIQLVRQEVKPTGLNPNFDQTVTHEEIVKKNRNIKNIQINKR